MSQSTSATHPKWENLRSILPIEASSNALYSLPEHKEYQKLLNDAPWKKNPSYFTTCTISPLALLKMTMHARSGTPLEIMGLMTGYVSGTTIVVTDAFRLPVEGTETRVNAQTEADEYQVNFGVASREGGGQLENPIGWYHSHPGYGCWLSGIDVSTQMQQQMLLDPFVAVVIDPDRTVSSGRVEIGAFRTYPEGHKPAKPSTDNDEYQTIPTGKMEDFGAHADSYYSLEVSHYKSTLDTHLLNLLWNKYWTSTLSQSPLSTNREYGDKQIADQAIKTRDAGRKIKQQTGGIGGAGMTGRKVELISTSTNADGSSSGVRIAKDNNLDQLVKGARKIAAEEQAGLLAAEVKMRLFHGVVGQAMDTLNGASGNAVSDAGQAGTTVNGESTVNQPITS